MADQLSDHHHLESEIETFESDEDENRPASEKLTISFECAATFQSCS